MTIGKNLVHANLISEDQLGSALAEARESARSLVSVLIERNHVSENAVAVLLDRNYSIRGVDLRTRVPAPASVALFFRHVSRKKAAELVVCPIDIEDKTLTLAMADPTDIALIDDLSSATALVIEPRFATEDAIRNALRALGPRARLRPRFPRVRRISSRVDFLAGVNAHTLELIGARDGARPLSSTPAGRLLAVAIIDGLRHDATAIHIEAYQTVALRVRYRIEDELNVVFQQPGTPGSPSELDEVFGILRTAANLKHDLNVVQHGRIRARLDPGVDRQELELDVTFQRLCWGTRLTLIPSDSLMGGDAAVPHTEIGRSHALFAAAGAGRARFVRKLLEAGADPNGSGASARPLMAAARAGHREVLEILLAAGADDVAKYHGQDALMMTAYHGHTECVQTLLDFCGGTAESRRRALELAAIGGHVDVVRELVKRGAPPDARVLVQSSARGMGDIVHELLDCWTIEAESVWVDALARAAEIGANSVVDLLLARAPKLHSCEPVIAALVAGATAVSGTRAHHLADYLRSTESRARLRSHVSTLATLAASDRFDSPPAKKSLMHLLAEARQSHVDIAALIERVGHELDTVCGTPVSGHPAHRTFRGFIELLERGALVTRDLVAHLGVFDRPDLISALRWSDRVSYREEDLVPILRWAQDSIGAFPLTVERQMGRASFDEALVAHARRSAEESHGIDLSGCSLSRLPDGLFDISGVTWINLNCNQLVTLPPEIAKFQELEELFASNNLLKKLPSELGALRKLRRIELCSNQLTDCHVLGELPMLESANLSSNGMCRVPRSIRDVCLIDNPIDTVPEHQSPAWPRTRRKRP